MRKVLDDIYILEGIGSANVFLLGNKSSFHLIDTGIFKMTHLLFHQIAEAGFDLKYLKTIVLTHCHCDHIGGVTELVKYSGAKTAAHTGDIPFILQQKVIDGPYHGMMLEEQKYMKQLGCNIMRIDITLSGGDTIDVLNGLKVIHVPGHTPGSIALYEESRKIMFFGDVIRNNKGKGLTVGIPEKFNCDTKQAIADAALLLGYPIDYALFSHGEPILEHTSDALKSFLGLRFK